MVKTVVLGLLFGMTLGVSVATELFSRIGMEPKTYMLIITAVVLAVMLLNRGIAIMVSGVLLSLAVIQPDQVLLEHGFDKDLLIATLAVLLLYPLVYRVLYS